MATRLSVLLMVFVMAFAVVACGDDEEPASGGGATTEESTPEETTPEPEATEATEEDPGGSGGGELADDQIAAAIEACKSSVEAQSGQLSEDVRADLDDICEEIKTGDAEEIRKLTIDVCVRVAEETVPDGTARQQVIDACEQAAP